MITTGALKHGDVGRHLAFNPEEHPVALQLGGSDPADLAHGARLGEQWGYSEINLNCGCPSERVQRGSFGACLMAEPALVADCMKAMLDAVSVPVTVKHRLGLDYSEDYGFVRDFVGMLEQAGVSTFIVHARNAVLKGLSPRANREVPPLRYGVAARLKRDFPSASFVVNGGISHHDQALEFLEEFDGVMLGRAAWHSPAILSELHGSLWPDVILSDADTVIANMVDYAEKQVARGVPLRFVTRAMLGWGSGQPGARQWRRTLSDSGLLECNDPDVILRAWKALNARQGPAATYSAEETASESAGQSRM